MNISLTIPQLFYDMIARVFPGFFFLFITRVCLTGTFIDPSGIITFQSTTSLGQVLDGLGFLVLCYFAGWLLRGLTWPNLRPDESDEFRRQLQRIRIQHPESGFRVTKLRAEAILLSSSRTGMFTVCILALLAWSLHNTENMLSIPIPNYSWALRIGLPAIIGIVFLWRERKMWRNYHGNVSKLHAVIIDEGYPRGKIVPTKDKAEQATSAHPGEAPGPQS